MLAATARLICISDILSLSQVHKDLVFLSNLSTNGFTFCPTATNAISTQGGLRRGQSIAICLSGLIGLGTNKILI